MAFTVTDFRDMIQLLVEHPEWKAELRRLVLSEDLLALPELMQDLTAKVHALTEAQRQADERLTRVEAAIERLTEAQRQADERLTRVEAAIERLTEAQRRTDESIQKLFEAQRQTDERLTRLEAAIERLAEAQRRTDESVQKLSEAQQSLATAVGQLQTAFGATVEEEAESVIQMIVESKGYRLLAEPFTLPLDGEIDVVMPLQDQSGATVWCVAEAKARLGRRQVRDWAQRIKSSGWQKRLTDRQVPGPYLVYVYGIRIDPGTVQEAELHGIGLATGRGERLAPQGLIQPSAD